MAAAASSRFFFLTLRLAAVVVGADDQPGGFRVGRGRLTQGDLLYELMQN